MTSEANIQPSILGDLGRLIKEKFSNIFTVVPVSSGPLKFISIWLTPIGDTSRGYSMKYLPLFYAIASLDEGNNKKLSLKLITFHGKIIDQINEADHPLMTNDDKLNFVGKLEKLKLCKGIEMPDADLKLDARTFSSMYLVERLQHEVIVRSYHCQYALYENSVCKMCTDLSVAYDHEEKLEGSNEPEFNDDVYDEFEGDVDMSLSYDYIPDMKPSIDINGDIQVNENCYPNDLNLLCRNVKQRSTVKKKKREKLCIKTSVEHSEEMEHPGKKEVKTTLIKCKHCSYQTRDIKQLMAHNMDAHSPRFDGTYCNETSALKCEYCSFKATTKKEYISHMTSHESNDYQCHLCEKVLNRKDALKSHMKKVHKRPYKCNLCPYETAQESRLTRHVTSVHEKIKRYFCDQCSYAASDNYSLKFHVMAVHEKVKPFICEHCTHATTTQKALTIHIRAVHEKLKPFICEHCSTGFATKYMLQMHVTVVHEKVKGFKCDQCSYETARKYYLDHHIKSVHEKVKQFKCDLCSFETAVKCNLKNHILAVHEKCKPFQCPHCPFEAIRKKQLTQHLANIHGEHT